MAVQFSSINGGRFEGGDFEVLPCNEGAHSLSMEFAHGQERFGAISGPHGCGKSHLLQNTAEVAHRELGCNVGFLSGANVDRPSYGFGRHDILIVDDLEANAVGGRARRRLEVELERRVRSGRPTLCAASTAIRTVRSLLPFPRRWKHAEMTEPSPEEREEILRSMCAAERLDLTDEVVRTVSRLIRGDGRALLGAVRRLKFACKKRRLEISPIRAAGVLDPLISKAAGFDLRNVVVDCVGQSLTAKDRRTDSHVHDQLTTYVLRDEALLAESNVADYLGMSPGEIFRLLRDARRRLSDSDPTFEFKLDSSMRLICRRLRDV